MLADKSAIARVIPHSGNMCLLDGILEYDTTHIRCISGTHRQLDNPLRTENKLLGLCGIEYAAQAMAVHGVYGGQIQTKPRTGFLVSVRDVSCKTMRLDTLHEDLIIHAEKLMGDDARVMYHFTLHAGDIEIMSGRATVLLDADKETI